MKMDSDIAMDIGNTRDVYLPWARTRDDDDSEMELLSPWTVAANDCDGDIDEIEWGNTLKDVCDINRSSMEIDEENLFLGYDSEGNEIGASSLATGIIRNIGRQLSFHKTERVISLDIRKCSLLEKPKGSRKAHKEKLKLELDLNRSNAKSTSTLTESALSTSTKKPEEIDQICPFIINLTCSDDDSTDDDFETDDESFESEYNDANAKVQKEPAPNQPQAEPEPEPETIQEEPLNYSIDFIYCTCQSDIKGCYSASKCACKSLGVPCGARCHPRKVGPCCNYNFINPNFIQGLTLCPAPIVSISN